MADEKDATNPGTEAFVPDFSDDDDTGTRSWVPDFSDGDDDATGTSSWVPDFSDDTGPQPTPPGPAAQKPDEAQAIEPAGDAQEDAAAAGGPVQSVTVPGRYIYLKWWKLALVLLGVWVVAAEIGLGLFYWWYHSPDKTPAAFAVLLYVVVSTVAGVMLAMVPGRPLVSALSVAVMSGPFAAVCAAAPLFGYYYCERMGHCLAGVLPY